MLVGVDDEGVAPALRDRHGDDLLREDAALLRRDGTSMRLHRERVLVLAADVELGTQILGGLDHAAGDGIVAATGGDAGARQTVVERHGLSADAVPHPGGVELGLTHRLDAAGEDEVAAAGLDLHHGLDDRLQPGTATPVHLQAGNVHSQIGVQSRNSSDRGRLAAGGRLAEDDVVDVATGNAGAGDDFGDHRGREILGGDVPEDATEAADGGTEGLADDCVRHISFLGAMAIESGYGPGRPRWRRLSRRRPARACRTPPPSCSAQPVSRC